MTTYENQVIGYTQLCWEVTASSRAGTVRVFATSKFNAERDGAIKLGVPQWQATARLAREKVLPSLGVA